MCLCANILINLLTQGLLGDKKNWKLEIELINENLYIQKPLINALFNYRII